jgi:hypothetical protein
VQQTLPHTRRPSSINHALHYLIDQQRNDGTFTSLPDQVGPRPIPYDFPQLANTHTLIALNRLLRTTSPTTHSPGISVAAQGEGERNVERR